MRAYLKNLSDVSMSFITAYPNAGLPNEFGGYDQGPKEMAGLIQEFASAGWVNVVGGCCGTSPAHIQAIAEAVEGITPRKKPVITQKDTIFSGLEALQIRPNTNFINIGERTNVTGSRKFARLIKENKYERSYFCSCGSSGRWCPDIGC